LVRSVDDEQAVIQAQEPHYNGTMDCLQKILTQEGWSGLFKCAFRAVPGLYDVAQLEAWRQAYGPCFSATWCTFTLTN